MVHQIGELAVLLDIAVLHGLVQHRDHVRVVGVVLLVVHELVLAALVNALARVPGAPGQVLLVLLEVGEARTLDARDGIREAQIHYPAAQAHDLEKLGAAVARYRRDAHLRHDLVEALVDALAIGARQIDVLAPGDLTAAAQIVERGVGQIGIDAGRAVADEAGEVVRVARGGRLDDEIAVRAQALVDQAVLHRAGGQQRVDGQLVTRHTAIRQHQDDLAGAHGGDGALADRLDGGLELRLGRIVVQVDDLMCVVGVLGTQRQHLLELAFGQHRRVDEQARSPLGGLVEDPAFGAQLAFQGHDDLLAQRIDGRVGDLGEDLPEVVVERALLLRQHGHGRVIAHRTDGFGAGLGQHAQHLLALLVAEVEELLVDRHRIGTDAVQHLGALGQPRLQPLHAVLQPALVGRTLGQLGVDVSRLQDLAVAGIDGDHLARTQAALLQHILGLVVPDADLRGQRDVAVLGQHIARRAQTVPVQAAGRVATIGQHNTGRPVPGLEIHRAVLEEGAHIRVEMLDVLPGRRDQRAHGGKDVLATGEQHFQHVVQ